VSVRHAWCLVLGVSLLSTLSVRAAEPGPLQLPAASASQQLADQIADVLRQSAVIKRYSIDIGVWGSDVVLRGEVADQAQREEVLRLTQGVPGVARVLDELKLAGQYTPVTPVQGKESAAQPKGGPELPSAPPMQLPPPDRSGMPGASMGPMPEPLAVGRLPAGAFSELNPPRMPPYAWPTYAPYNNFSRVATPLAYPWQAFPFIGPHYPFPKVPLGWRSVKLEFDDGYWWYGQVGNKYNWWKIRYW